MPSVAIVYSGLPGPTSNARFIFKRTIKGKRENVTQKAYNKMKGLDIKAAKKKSILSLIASYIVT